MHAHEKDPRIMMMDRVSDARRLRPTMLQRIFNRSASFQGAILKSEELAKLAESFDPMTGAYEELKFSAQGLQRMVTVRNGKISYHQLAFDSLGVMDAKYAPHREGKPYIEEWHRLLDEFSDLIHPAFESSFNVRLQVRSSTRAGFHKDEGKIIATLPLGKNQLSTLWKNDEGEIITPEPGSLFINTPAIDHSTPGLASVRAVLMAYCHIPQ